MCINFDHARYLVKSEVHDPFRAPCGYCSACKQARIQEWTVRIYHEIESSKLPSYFFTFTYDDDYLPFPPHLNYNDFSAFIKRLRRYYDHSGKGESIKFFVVGEYGETTHRPHFHAIITNCFIPDKFTKGKYSYSDKISELWGKGFCSFFPASTSTVGYMLKYLTKRKIDGLPYPRYRMSKGFGLAHLSRHFDWRKGYYDLPTGRAAIPRYYKKKLLSYALFIQNMKKGVDNSVEVDRINNDSRLRHSQREDDRAARRELSIKKRGEI